MEHQSGIIRVDLSSRSVTSEPIPDSWHRKYVGGKGLGARYLFDELEAETDPLSEANVLLFLTGPLTGYLPGEQRYVVVTKSPQTGTFLDSYAGGTIAGRLAGSLGDHAGILVTGRASEPVSLSVTDGDVTIESSPELWGLDVRAVDDQFPDAATACIGPAGEHGVTFATIASDGGDHHAGRGGAGAVMGTKRLKAIVAHDSPPEPNDRLRALREKYEQAYAADETGRWQATSETLETVDFANEVGVLPTHGWQASRFDGADEIGISAARAAAHERERADDAVPGGFRVDGDEGESVPRGSTPISLGAGLGIDDFDAVATLGSICDQLALDVISSGNAVAWAIRANEEGYIDRDLEFGDDAAARRLIEEIATRSTKLGDVLADGVEAAADEYGGSGLIPTIKGMDLPSYDPRGATAMALAYATSDRGACHRRARPVEAEALAPNVWTTDQRVDAVVTEQNRRAVLWSLVADDFFGDALAEDLGSEWLEAVGREYDREELARVGERIWTLVRLFNVREGFDRSDDDLPTVVTEPPEPKRQEDHIVDPAEFEAMLKSYYEHRGWDYDGRPTESMVRRLGIDEDLEGIAVSESE